MVSVIATVFWLRLGYTFGQLETGRDGRPRLGTRRSGYNFAAIARSFSAMGSRPTVPTGAYTVEAYGLARTGRDLLEHH